MQISYVSLLAIPLSLLTLCLFLWFEEYQRRAMAKRALVKCLSKSVEEGIINQAQADTLRCILLERKNDKNDF